MQPSQSQPHALAVLVSLVLALTGSQLAAAGEPEAYQHLAERMDRYFADNRARLIESYATPYPPGPDGTLEHIAFIYDNALAVAAFASRGTPDDVRRAGLICDALLWYQNHDPLSDGRLRQAYRADQDLITATRPKIPTGFNHSLTGELAWTGLAWLTYFQRVRDPAIPNPINDPNVRYLQAAITIKDWLVAHVWDPVQPGWSQGDREVSTDMTVGVPLANYATLAVTPQDVVIPLTAFASQGLNLERLRAFSLVFDDPSWPTGTISFEAIRLVNPSTGAVLVIDDFADFNPVRNSLGFDIGGIVDISLDPTGRTLRWNNTDGSIDWWYSLLVANPNNLPRLDGADYTQLVLRVAGAVGGERFTVQLQGYPLQPQRITAKATEHNLDVYVLCHRLRDLGVSDANLPTYADEAKQFVTATAWDATEGKFWAGTLSDQSLDRTHWVEDVQSWAMLALGRVAQYGGALGWAASRLGLSSDGFTGFDYGINTGVGDPWYSPTPDGVWFEGTAQMASAYQVSGRQGGVDFSPFYLGELNRAQQSAGGANGKAIVAASHDGVTTGFPFFSYFASPHIGATAWYLAATRRTNLFWNTSTDAAVPHDDPPPTGGRRRSRPIYRLAE
ncbi:MAG: hypothetical protein HY597_00675 [Candidatus Omnitrophica bacterium]|nr:hypothetical protein [Candidatus Omnitrophota bacterium]